MAQSEIGSRQINDLRALWKKFWILTHKFSSGADAEMQRATLVDRYD